ncbi:hypothetical protein BDN71DRAFT_1432732 [Pleurotus eryngii]|uniref:Uncharacterized protein n=1 Tax=Pleurotus eryngii TaxID=5323 RepID=A0A9P6DEF1_PLEER|nr:hypothetical protein BDN71DRAFT_1432732 [Pleurotus eryngii]
MGGDTSAEDTTLFKALQDFAGQLAKAIKWFNRQSKGETDSCHCYLTNLKAKRASLVVRTKLDFRPDDFQTKMGAGGFFFPDKARKSLRRPPLPYSGVLLAAEEYIGTGDLGTCEENPLLEPAMNGSRG